MREVSSVLFVVLFVCLSGIPLETITSDLLPDDRLYDWGSYSGVPGGIPNRTTIFRTLTPANTVAEINAAIAACPSGQVVYLSTGTYNLGAGSITFGKKAGVTLRGSGGGPNDHHGDFKGRDPEWL
jgi:hypothetical protein